MAGVFLKLLSCLAWMAGTSPAMTAAGPLEMCESDSPLGEGRLLGGESAATARKYSFALRGFST
jgi:hypothetical protein